MQDLGGEGEVLQLAWRIVNDSLRTDVCLLFPPYEIALCELLLLCPYFLLFFSVSLGLIFIYSKLLFPFLILSLYIPINSMYVWLKGSKSRVEVTELELEIQFNQLFVI